MELSRIVQRNCLVQSDLPHSFVCASKTTDCRRNRQTTASNIWTSIWLWSTYNVYNVQFNDPWIQEPLFNSAETEDETVSPIKSWIKSWKMTKSRCGVEIKKKINHGGLRGREFWFSRGQKADPLTTPIMNLAKVSSRILQLMILDSGFWILGSPDWIFRKSGAGILFRRERINRCRGIWNIKYDY